MAYLDEAKEFFTPDLGIAGVVASLLSTMLKMSAIGADRRPRGRNLFAGDPAAAQPRMRT